MVKSFGAFNDWVGFMDVDEYCQPNASVGDALASGAATLTGMLDAELAAPRADGVLCDSLQFQMWQVSFCDEACRNMSSSRVVAWHTVHTVPLYKAHAARQRWCSHL